MQFSSVAQSYPTLCDPMNRSTPGLPVHHQLLEFTQTHIHQVSNAIQPSHPLSSPSPPAPNPSQHQSLLQWVNSSHEVAKVLEFQLQHHSSKEIPGLISFRMDWLDLLADLLGELINYDSEPWRAVPVLPANPSSIPVLSTRLSSHSSLKKMNSVVLSVLLLFHDICREYLQTVTNRGITLLHASVSASVHNLDLSLPGNFLYYSSLHWHLPYLPFTVRVCIIQLV